MLCKRHIALALGAAAMMLPALLSGCTKNWDDPILVPPDPPAAYTSFTDSAGETIVLQEKPERVAVLFSSFAELWQLAGGTVAVTVGESVERGFVPEGTPLVDDGAGKKIDLERLLIEEPDFVICSGDIAAQAETAETLTGLDIPAAQFVVESFSDYLDVLKICTDITGDETAFEQYGAAQKQAIDTILAENSFEGVDILFVRAGSSARSVKAKTSEDHFAAEMLQEFGTHNIADDSLLAGAVLSDTLSIEYILQEDPDYIFFTAMGDEEASQNFVKEMLQESAWQQLTAVRQGNYAFLEKELFHFKPNGRWAEAYETLARLLHTIG